MFRWFPSKKGDLPSYSLLEAVPCRGLPQDLSDRENSAEHCEWRDKIESELFAEIADETAPGFATFLKTGNGPLNLRLPEVEEGCLLVSSNVLRAADYARVQVPEKEFQSFLLEC